MHCHRQKGRRWTRCWVMLVFGPECSPGTTPSGQCRPVHYKNRVMNFGGGGDSSTNPPHRDEGSAGIFPSGCILSLLRPKHACVAMDTTRPGPKRAAIVVPIVVVVSRVVNHLHTMSQQRCMFLSSHSCRGAFRTALAAFKVHEF